MTTKELTRSKPAERAQGSPPAAPYRLSPFDILQSEIDQVFDRFNGFGWPGRVFREPFPAVFSNGGFAPSMEVVETDNAIEVTAELPGADEKDVEINVAEDTLTIRGEKKYEKDEKKKHYRLIERSYGSFERSVPLPPGVDASRIKAKMSKGVLKVEIPKPVAVKAQPVKIVAE